jgi:hypothetical protein
MGFLGDFLNGIFGGGKDSPDDKSSKVNNEQSVEFINNSVKTTIHAAFNEDGYPIGFAIDVQYVPTPEEELENQKILLQKEIDEAVAVEDYIKAADLQRRRDQLLKTNE